MTAERRAILDSATAEAPPGTSGRFGFGANWRRYLDDVDSGRIDAAEAALADLLGRQSLAGMRLLDIGSGSGIHSLAAVRLGADVTSFDFDEDSVACTMELRRRFAETAGGAWRVVGRGSVLDRDFMQSLGYFDVVYSWGVLHHTGALERAVYSAASRVSVGGFLAVALYNDQRWISSYWTAVKRIYNTGSIGRMAMIATHLPYVSARALLRAARGRDSIERGMSLWHDYIDWLGGWPFEVASPDTVSSWVEPQGFVRRTIRSVGRRQGCNEFVYERIAAD
jgi:2-polyprenyl-3-methyl-5-hydroxy-6-metoxy-1,4-benzoquinol methylase